MRIGEVARRAGVSAKAVRRYEALGLISPERLANGYRSFDEQDVRAVREVRDLRELGIPAERARPFLECLATGAGAADDCPSSLAEYRTAIDELTSRIAELADRRDRLAGRLHAAAHRTLRPAPVAPQPVPDLAERLTGLPLPALEFPATSGERVRIDRLGAGRTVLYLYPLTGRPDVDLPEGWLTIPGAHGCTAEACGFRDHHQELLAAGATAVYGLSSQDTGYQRELLDRLGLPFAVLSDPALALADALGLPTFTVGDRRLYTRLTLVLRAGVIEHVFHPVHPPGEHAAQVLSYVDGAG